MDEKVKRILIVLGVTILCASIIFILLFTLKNRRDVTYTDFVRTYHIMSVEDDYEVEYVNLVIREYDSDETTTVRVLRNLIEDEILEDEPYEFTFDYEGEKLEDNIEAIFSNMTLKSVKITDKYGLQERQDNL